MPPFVLQEPPPEIESLDHLSLYAQLGLLQLMEPDTEELMVERAERELVDDEYDSPHARAWFKSFHASEFPGDRVDACERYLLYRMMNTPKSKIMPPYVTTCGTVGKAGELDIASAWYLGGRMLGVPEDMEDQIRWDRLPPRILDDEGKPLKVRQLGFTVPEVWMTGSTDLPILKRGWTKPYIVEVKGKASEVLEEMCTGRRKDGSMAPKLRPPDASHIRQLKATIGAARLFDWGEIIVCEHCWRIAAWTHLPALYGVEWEANAGPMPQPWSDSLYYCPWCETYDPVCLTSRMPDGRPDDDTFYRQLDPPDCGEIYYWDRSWPRKTKSFFYTHDQEFFDSGLEVLASARQHFIDDVLPPRPDHFQWSVGPCGGCAQKPHCRLDYGLETSRHRKPKKGLVRSTLSTSNAVDYAKSVRPHYNLAIIKAMVMAGWESMSSS